MIKLTERRRKLLQYYELHRDDPNRIVPEDVPISSSMINWLLDQSLICVGPKGWHIASDLGRAALSTGGADGE